MTLYDWSHCRSCGAKVYWLKHEKTGKPAPIDVAPSDAGNIEIDLSKHTYRNIGKNELKRELEQQNPDQQPARHTNHFQTCPSAAIWKRHGGTGMRGPRYVNQPKPHEPQGRAKP